MKYMVRLLLGMCLHENTTRVFTERNGSITRSYVCCLDCAQRIPYDWKGLGAVPVANVAQSQAPQVPCNLP
jgi:hypothetical protein